MAGGGGGGSSWSLENVALVWYINSDDDDDDDETAAEQRQAGDDNGPTERCDSYWPDDDIFIDSAGTSEEGGGSCGGGGGDRGGETTPATTAISLPYGALLPVVADLVVRFQERRRGRRRMMNLHNSPNDVDVPVSPEFGSRQFVVGVSIPEGPYQCVTIAACHCWKGAIIVPFDLHVEGKERLRHMVMIADIILVASGTDVETIVRSLSSPGTGPTTNSDGPEGSPPTPPPAQSSSSSSSVTTAMDDSGVAGGRRTTTATDKIWNVKDLLRPRTVATTYDNSNDDDDETNKSANRGRPMTTASSPPPPSTAAAVPEALSSGVASSSSSSTASQSSPSLTARVAQFVPADQRIYFANDDDDADADEDTSNAISHMVFTSGTGGGRPKACVSSRRALLRYVQHKNGTHAINSTSTVLLASNLSFDPCFSDIIATWTIGATLQIASTASTAVTTRRRRNNGATGGGGGRGGVFANLDHVTHILTTPSLWGAAAGGAALLGATTTTTAATADTTAVIAAARAFAPKLQVLALGGEPIPPSIRAVWSSIPNLRLCATYGVTEACVYQTFGAVVAATPRTYVGRPLGDTKIRICDEHVQDDLVDIVPISSRENPGEIVLWGGQIDRVSCYYNMPELSATKFVVAATTIEDNDAGGGGTNNNGHTNTIYHYHYRTGDRGYVDHDQDDDGTGALHVLGRIAGADNTVKFRGVRVDLCDMEYALLSIIGIVTDAVVVAVKDDDHDTTSVRDIVAYVVLHDRCMADLFNDDTCNKTADDCRRPNNGTGWVCNDVSLVYLLRTVCTSTARTSPTKFIIIPRMPLTATGKRDKRALPPIDHVESSMPLLSNISQAAKLDTYGRCGSTVATEITTCLNLTVSQRRDMVTVASTFTMLGGDSLTATRVVRAIYARHMQIRDTRHLGGPTGILTGPFAVEHFLNAENLGAYVDWLDRNGVCSTTAIAVTSPSSGADNDTIVASDIKDVTTIQPPGLVQHQTNSPNNPGYDALLHATASGYAAVAIALVRYCGVDPNHDQQEGQRLGKTNRLERKRDFRSNPLHLACRAGMDDLVTALLQHGANPKCPNASGMFPIHLGASGSTCPVGDVVPMEEQNRRLHCFEQLLLYGSPLVMADGSQQTVLHAAARSGNTLIVQCALDRWPTKLLNLRDQWSRTPVHWAVLNGRIETLRSLLANDGIDPNPRIFGSKHVKSSVLLETPLDMCRRVFHTTATNGNDDIDSQQHHRTTGTELGRMIETMLQTATEKWSISLSSTSQQKK